VSTGLCADFRRVEGSWREADKALRHNIINKQQHRGSIVDQLLDGHEALLDTAEGRVFESFQAQLRQSVELELMRERLREILKHEISEQALSPQQQNDLRFLVARLVKESEVVFQARARSERNRQLLIRLLDSRFQDDDRQFYQWLLLQERGRLEQEYLQEVFVHDILGQWAATCPLTQDR